MNIDTQPMLYDMHGYMTSGIAPGEINEMRDLARRWEDYRRMANVGAVCPNK